ncbi:phage terminase small subunit [Bradyrhizobium sp. LM2.7]
MPPNVYSALDSFVLSAFATAWAIHKRATHEMGSPGFVWTSKTKRGAESENVWIKIARQQAAQLASLGDRLGLRPKKSCCAETARCRATQEQIRWLARRWRVAWLQELNTTCDGETT